MPTATQSIAIKAPVERVFKVITDFENFPDFQPAVEVTKVLKRTKMQADVAFTINLIATVHYTLRFKFDHHKRVSWTTLKSDALMKDNTGFWKITHLDANLTDLTCTMDVKFSFWVPDSIIENLLKNHLPDMLKRFKARAESKKKRQRQ